MVSILFPVAVIASIAMGGAILLSGWFLAGKEGENRATSLVLASLLALLVNGWWIFVLAVVIYKLFILKEDP